MEQVAEQATRSNLHSHMRMNKSPDDLKWYQKGYKISFENPIE